MTVAALYSKHQDIALAIARDWHLPGADRDDVRQEARIALWEACLLYQPDRGPFPPFARLVVKRRLKDRLTAARRGKRAVLTDASREGVEFLSTTDPLEARAALRDLTRLCAALNAKERATLERIVNEVPIVGKTDDTQRYRLRKKLAT